MTIEQIDSLYNQINSYILGNFQLFWTIIIGAFTILGVALFFLAKTLIAQGIEKASEKHKNRFSDLESRMNQIRASTLRYRPTEYDLPLADGIEKSGACCFSKNADDLVCVTISVKSSSEKLKPRIHTIATLPAGFQPTEVISQTVSDSTVIRIYKNGTIVYDTTSSSLKELSYASILFYASEK